MEIELLVGWLASAPFDASVRGEVRAQAERKAVVINGGAAACQIEGFNRDCVEGDRRMRQAAAISCDVSNSTSGKG